MMKTRLQLAVLFLLVSILSPFGILAQAPAGYYNSANGLTGTPLRLALHNIIDNHTVKSYDFLWTAFKTTDDKPNGKVWDMYSDKPSGTPAYEYTFGSDQCGNYSGEGDCYNREHSWPKSWFNDASPMVSDMFHLYPTDGYVNGKRSNYPFGEVNSATWTSTNGSKLGSCSYPGYSGTVFEPIDEYKGDFARTYFYMCTRYYTEDGSWQSNGMVDGANLKPWAVNMLLEWHHNDPVSQKEIDRNNTVYGFQNNRNPFIDHPEWADYIWDPNVGIEDGSSKVIVSVYPNPCTTSATIAAPFKMDNSSVTVSSFDGRTLHVEYSVVDDKVVLITSNLPNGVYLLTITDNRSVATAKLVKR